MTLRRVACRPPAKVSRGLRGGSAAPRSRRAAGALAGLAAALLVLATGHASPLREAIDATTELDLDRSARLLSDVDSEAAAVAIERARLAVYRGDCLTASVTLDTAAALDGVPELESLRAVARGCAEATAGALVVEDRRRGVWIRLQDARDRALVPFLVDGAVRARGYLEREFDLGLPRPLRIELVQDLFSLSALTGLPVEAAETTGTVGVARWGRVVLVSPRATPRGYPWEDTLAHELVHLFVTRATRDHAPLWLQEGIAKQHEARWRDPRPFDDGTDHDAVARGALLAGRAVGIDALGRSIALLPTPEIAATAYSEVTSFVGILRATAGQPALRLLFADLRGLGGDDADPALRSVTGYDLAAWRARWEAALRARAPSPAPTAAPPALTVRSVLEVRDLVRRVRLAELLTRRGHHGAASLELAPALAKHPGEASLRWRAARAALAQGQEAEAAARLGDVDGIDAVHGGWFALRGRFAQSANDDALAARLRAVSVAVDPLIEDVACQGHPSFARAVGAAGQGEDDDRSPGAVTYEEGLLPDEEPWRALCLAARAVRRD